MIFSITNKHIANFQLFMYHKKQTMLIWPFLDFLEMFLFLLFYYLQLTGDFNSFSRMLMNMVLTYSKLVITELCRPFESEILYNTERNAKRILVIMFLATLVRIVPYIKDTVHDKEVENICNANRHFMAGIMIWASYVMFFLLILLSFLDFFFYNGLLFEWCRKKFKGLLGDSLDDDDMEDDKFSEFLKLEEEYRIPADQLQILTDNDSDPIYLGAGGFGSVYKATWAQDEGYPVAAKELNATKMEDPNERETFADEVKNLISANHRNVINFYGICEQMDYNRDPDGIRRRFIVMEYAENGSLESMLSKIAPNYLQQINAASDEKEKLRLKSLCYPLTPARFLRWAVDIAAGLKYLNSKGMPHQDVKPHNILLDRHDTIKICDLGFKKLKEVSAAASKLPKRRLQYSNSRTSASSGRNSGKQDSSSGRNSGKQVSGADDIFEERGTAQYKSPEAFHTLLEDWGEEIDVWAFGVLLMRMASLRQPFDMSRETGVSIRDIFLLLPAKKLLPFDYFNRKTVHFVHPKIQKLVELCLDLSPAKRPSFKKIVGLLACMLEDAENGVSEMSANASHGHVESLNPLYGMLSNSSSRRASRFSRRQSQARKRGNQARRKSDSSRLPTTVEKAGAKKKNRKNLEILTQ